MSPIAVGVRIVEWENITSSSAWKVKLHYNGWGQDWSCFVKKQLSMHFEVQPLFLLTGESLIRLIGQKQRHCSETWLFAPSSAVTIARYAEEEDLTQPVKESEN